MKILTSIKSNYFISSSRPASSCWITQNLARSSTRIKESAKGLSGYPPKEVDLFILLTKLNDKMISLNYFYALFLVFSRFDFVNS